MKTEQELEEGTDTGMEDIIAVEDDGSPFEKKEMPIHTVFVIKDGSFDVGARIIDEKSGKVTFPDLEGKRYVYRLHSKIPGYAVVDYDKNNLVPIAKDIFNRQNTFIEITYLKWIAIIVAVSFIILGIVAYVSFGNKPQDFNPQKKEIIDEIRKSYTQIASSAFLASQNKSETSSGSTKSDEDKKNMMPTLTGSTDPTQYKYFFNGQPLDEINGVIRVKPEDVEKPVVKKPVKRPVLSAPVIIEEEDVTKGS